MEILGYIIPKSLETNDFIRSIYEQSKKKDLTLKQNEAFLDIIGYEEDFFEFDFPCPQDMIVQGLNVDFDSLKEKLKRDRFRKTSTKNKCIRALKSIIYSSPRYGIIDEVLERVNYWRR